MTTKRLVRTTGAIEETLDGCGLTKRDEAFDCPQEIADRVLGDGSGRFRLATDGE